jgi:hypothetical protein
MVVLIQLNSRILKLYEIYQILTFFKLVILEI